MLRHISLLLMTGVATLSASRLHAQEASHLGLNLAVTGVQHIGITYRAGERLELRPAVNLDWRRPAGNTLGGTVIDYGLRFDLLFPAPTASHIRTYMGVGGAWLFTHTCNQGNGHTLEGAALFGVRARVLPRIHLYGEAALRYGASRGAGRVDQDELNLETTPLAVLIYLK